MIMRIHPTSTKTQTWSILTGLMLCFFTLVSQQEAQAKDPSMRLSLREAPDQGLFEQQRRPRWGRSDFYRGAVGVQVGTYGFGAHYFQPIGADQQFGLRLGIGFMPIKTSISGTYSDRDTESKVKATFNNADLSFHWFPLKSQANFLKSLSVHAGAVYLFKLQGELETRLAEDYQFGDIAIRPEDVGVMRTTVKWDRKVNPTVGVGLNNMELNDYLAFSVNLGCGFLSSPKVDIVGDGLLVNNTGNAATIENNMKNYRFLPKLEVGISYTLR